MARFRLPRPRGRGALLLLLAIPSAALLLAAVALNPILEARAERRLRDRFGDVRSVELQRSPLAWLTGSPVRATIALGDATLSGAPLARLAGADRIDELDLTADSLTLRRVHLDDVRIRGRGDALTVRGTVSTQRLTLAGREMTVTPDADGGALILRPEGLAAIQELRVVPSGGGVEATIVGGPLDGRSVPLGGGGGDDGAARLASLDASRAPGGVSITAQLTRQGA